MKKTNRNTYQKETIYKELKKMSSFFTGEELFNKINHKNKNIGIATVYRFLADLRSKKQIHTFICDRKMIYSLNMKNHCHFICEKCNKIEHITIEKLDFLKNKKVEVCHFQIDLYGICEKCKYN